MSIHLDDKRVRLAAFEWLKDQVILYGDVLPRELLVQGFELDGQRIPLMSVQGIFKPKVLAEIPISITSTVHGPYDDRMDSEGLLLYKYRGTDPNHRENVGLREAMSRGIPLIYFHGIVRGKYMAIWPVFIIGDNPENLMFTVTVDDPSFIDTYARMSQSSLQIREPQDAGRRSYITAEVKRRLHQSSFRERVLLSATVLYFRKTGN